MTLKRINRLLTYVLAIVLVIYFVFGALVGENPLLSLLRGIPDVALIALASFAVVFPATLWYRAGGFRHPVGAVHFFRGVAALLRHKPDAALFHFSIFTKYNAENANVYEYMALAYHQQGNLEDAYKQYTHSIARDSSMYTAYNGRGEIYFERKEYLLALADFQKALEIKSASKSALAGKAITDHALEHIDAATTAWKSLVAKNARYKDPDWVKQKLNWAEPLVEEARKLIAHLDD